MAPEVDLSLLRAAFKEDTAVSVEVKKAAFSVRVGLSTHLWLVFPYRTHLTPIWINNTAFSLKNRCQTGSRTVCGPESYEDVAGVASRHRDAATPTPSRLRAGNLGAILPLLRAILS